MVMFCKWSGWGVIMLVYRDKYSFCIQLPHYTDYLYFTKQIERERERERESVGMK